MAHVAKRVYFECPVVSMRNGRFEPVYFPFGVELARLDYYRQLEAVCIETRFFIRNDFHASTVWGLLRGESARLVELDDEPAVLGITTYLQRVLEN